MLSSGVGGLPAERRRRGPALPRAHLSAGERDQGLQARDHSLFQSAFGGIACGVRARLLAARALKPRRASVASKSRARH